MFNSSVDMTSDSNRNYVYRPSKSTLKYDVTENGLEKTHRLTWRIPRFLSILNCQNVNSYETEHVDNIEKQFKVKIQFCGKLYEYMEAYIFYTEHVALTVNLNILKRSNDEMYTNIITAHYTNTPSTWERLMLWNTNRIQKYCYYNGGQFVLNIKFAISFIMYDPLVENKDFPCMSNDLKWLLDSSNTSDVVMKSAEGFEFKVHKVRLSSRSTVLKSALKHATVANNFKIIESHFTTEVLKEVLKYIYTDNAPKVQEMADKLLPAANFYNLPELKMICEEMLYLGLTTENAVETLFLADLYSATRLRKKTIDFINDDNLKIITM